ncbi:class I lanthipeptide [Kordia sp.]|uniref:class I lanthipeptide n=1 Tax=Kordia sp. TaxID=1965332 RepID=UPI003B5A6F78
MKKKEFSSKLQFQKTTVVSFNKMTNIIGGTIQNEDTRIVSVDGYTCLTDRCGTNRCDNETLNETCTSCNTSCTRPPTRSGVTDYCGAADGDTKRD